MKYGWVLCALVVACGDGSGSDNPGLDTISTDLTYNLDIKPILESNCVVCHQAGGIAPFTLTSYDDVYDARFAMIGAVRDFVMPPWLPDDSCNKYEYSRALDPRSRAQLLDWLSGGAPRGNGEADSGDAPKPVVLENPDVTLKVPTEYVPQITPDDYRCFAVDWPYASDTFVTGFNLIPDNTNMTHHALVFATPASAASQIATLEAEDPQPGYTCFGGTRTTEGPLIAAWAPGGGAKIFPQGTGIRVEGGAKIVIQMHYNTIAYVPVADAPSMEFSVSDTIPKEAFSTFFANPNWLGNGGMKIPANDPDVGHAYQLDYTRWLGWLTDGALPNNTPIEIHAAALHMHTLGKSIKFSIQRSAGEEECLVDIPRWDFNWQDSYQFATPTTVNPGDLIRLECHWDNTAENQYVVNDEKLPVRDVQWGEGTTDEMCLAIFYMTAAD